MFNLRENSYSLQNLGGTTDTIILSGIAFESPPGLRSTGPSRRLDRDRAMPMMPVGIHVDADIELVESH